MPTRPCSAPFQTLRYTLGSVFVSLIVLAAARAQVTVEPYITPSQTVPAIGAVRRIDSAMTGAAPGQAAFRGTFQHGPNTSDTQDAIFSGTTRIVKGTNTFSPPGDQAPGATGFFSLLGDPIANASGAVAFTASADEGYGIWTGSSLVQLVAINGGAAPGTNGNFDFRGDAGNLRAFNDLGQVAFTASVAGAPSDSVTGTSSGIWVGAPGNVSLLVRGQDPAPGYPAGVVFLNTFNSSVALNDAGQAAFAAATTVKSSGGGGLSGGIFLGTPGALQAVAKSGDRVPETESGVEMLINGGGHAPGLNARGEVAFVISTVSREPNPNGSGTAILAGAPGALRLVARSGMQAPGLAAGVRFTGVFAPAINNTGDVVFGALAGPSGQEAGCIYSGRAGQLRLIAQTGDLAPGTGDRHFTGLENLTSLLSDSGQVAFVATLDGGSGGERGLFATDQAGVLRLISRTGQNGSLTIFGYGLNPQYGQADTAASTSDGRRSSFDAAGNLIFAADVTDGTNFFRTSYRATFATSVPVIFPEGQPRPVRAVLGGSATFSVVAHGQRPATYKWRLNGVDLPNANEPVLTLTNLTEAARGNYSVLVTNGVGAIESAPAALSFPPIIIGQPAVREAVASGGATTLTVVPGGPGTLRVQWQFRAFGAPDFTNIAGSAALSLAGITHAQAGRYRAVVSSADGSVTSSESELTVAALGRPLIKPLLFSGDRNTEFGAELYFSGVDEVAANNAGAVSFTSGLKGPDGAFGSGTSGAYFGQTEGYRALVQRPVSPPFRPNLSDSGDTTLLSTGFFLGTFHGRPGALQILAQQDTPAPDAGGAFKLPSELSINASGTVAFNTGIGFGRDKLALYIGKPGALQLLVQQGKPAPGLAAGVNFGPMGGTEGPSFNDSGIVAFVGFVEGTGITQANDEGIWLAGANGVQRVLAEGSAAPGIAGATIGGFQESGYELRINNAGQIVFANSLHGVATGSEVIYAGAPGSLQIAARSGQTAGTGFTFGQLTNDRHPPLINGAGQVLFFAYLDTAGGGLSLHSLWRWTPGANGGTRKLIAREGQQAPGCPAGVLFDRNGFRAFDGFGMNLQGQVYFTAFLTGPGVNDASQNNFGLWMTDAAGNAQLVARTGVPFDTGGGNLRAPQNVRLPVYPWTGGQDGHPRVLTDDGRLVFTASFTAPETSGIFRATLPSGGGGENSPIAATGVASNLTQAGAKLTGTVNPNGAAAAVRFEYGLTTGYGEVTPVQNVSAGSSAVSLSALITGLSPNTLYHFRILAGGIAGADATFTTSVATVNSGPAGGNMLLSATSAVIGGSAVEVSFNGWTDKDKPLSYSVTLDGVEVVPRGTARLVSITAPAGIGAHSVAGTIADKLGNATVVTKSFTVAATPSVAGIAQIVSSGTAMAPSTGVPGGTWLSFGVPNALNDGKLGFMASFHNAEGLIYSGIFGGLHDSPLLLLPNRGPATDRDGNLLAAGAFASFREPVFSGADQFAVQATLSGATSQNDTGIWALTRGKLRLVAREGDPAPGTAGAKFSAFSSYAMSGEKVFFTALVKGGVNGGSDFGLWTCDVDNGTVLIVRESSELVVRVNDTRRVRSFQSLIPRAGSPGEGGCVDGAVSVLVTFTDGSQATARAGLSGGLQIFRLTGTSVNGAAAPTSFSIPDLLLSESGYAMLERYADKTIAVTSDAGIVAQTKMDAPGTGAKFKALGLPIIGFGNDSTDTFFSATVTGPGFTGTSDFGLWLKQSGSPLTLLTREGNAAPGTGGARFKTFTSLALLANRGPVFVATLKAGTGVPVTNGSSDTGVWALSEAGALVKLLREGDQIGGKLVRTMNFLGAIAGSPAQSRAFGNREDLLGRVFFSDGSSAIIKIIVP